MFCQMEICFRACSCLFSKRNSGRWCYTTYARLYGRCAAPWRAACKSWWPQPVANPRQTFKSWGISNQSEGKWLIPKVLLSFSYNWVPFRMTHLHQTTLNVMQKAGCDHLWYSGGWITAPSLCQGKSLNHLISSYAWHLLILCNGYVLYPFYISDLILYQCWLSYSQRRAEQSCVEPLPLCMGSSSACLGTRGNANGVKPNTLASQLACMVIEGPQCNWEAASGSWSHV